MIQVPSSSADPVYIYATGRGRVTLDQGEGGGNPFASALVDLLSRDEQLIFDKFRRNLIDLTARKSKNFQHPDLVERINLEGWQLLPKPPAETRVALVLVFSDYSKSEAMSSLPGAEHDLHRVALALIEAGFDVQKLLNPDRGGIEAAMRDLAERSASVDASALYTTGHGVEVDGIVYLLPGDYPFSQGSDALEQHAWQLTELAGALKARHVNLVFYAGCRDNPFGAP